jgi:hypothetical protein
VVIVPALPFAAAGYGLLRRRGFGRILALILGAISGFYAICLTHTGLTEDLSALVFAAIAGAYCATTFIVLLNRRRAAEFLPPGAGSGRRST